MYFPRLEKFPSILFTSLSVRRFFPSRFFFLSQPSLLYKKLSSSRWCKLRRNPREKTTERTKIGLLEIPGSTGSVMTVDYSKPSSPSDSGNVCRVLSGIGTPRCERDTASSIAERRSPLSSLKMPANFPPIETLIGALSMAVFQKNQLTLKQPTFLDRIEGRLSRHIAAHRFVFSFVRFPAPFLPFLSSVVRFPEKRTETGFFFHCHPPKRMTGLSRKIGRFPSVSFA